LQEFQQLMPDEETFRRVWKRVMPEDQNSPIVLRQPEPRGEEVMEPVGEETLLRQILEELDGGMRRTAAIASLEPGGRGLWESVRRSAAQARSAWFLLTGQRWQSRSRPSGRRTPKEHLMREQYLWEVNFSRLCRDGRRSGEETAEEILPELERESRRRRGMIRNLLAGR